MNLFPEGEKHFYCDEETTGTDSLRHGIHQIAFKIYIGDELKEEHVWKIQPFPDDVIEDEALAVSGVTREELFNPDRMTPKQAYDKLILILSKYVDRFNKRDKFFWRGYKAQFDYDFTYAWAKKCGDQYFGAWFFNPVNCVMILAGWLLRKIRPLMKDFKQRTVWELLFQERLLEFPEERWHDALFDLDRTRDIEIGLREIFAGKRKLPNL